MARLELLPQDMTAPKALVEAVRSRRKGGHLLNLDRILLYSPELTEGWNMLAARLRQGTTLQSDLLEMVICLVAYLNGADYELHHHLPLWREAGATDAQIDALEVLAKSDEDEAVKKTFDARERAVIALVWEMTKEVVIGEATFEALIPHFDERQIVELVGLVGFYNMVSRFLVALDIENDA